MTEVAKGIEEHIPALRRYAIALARNTSSADDLVQECAERALTKAQQYQPGTNLRAWLFTILHNVHVNQVRHDAKWKGHSDPDTALASLSVPPRQMASVMLEQVRTAMMSLPDQHRSILYSIGVEGKSYDEASTEFGIPVGTVKSRCSRAREALQQNLTGLDGDEATSTASV